MEDGLAECETIISGEVCTNEFGSIKIEVDPAMTDGLGFAC